jgi:hypothetical protein
MAEIDFTLCSSSASEAAIIIKHARWSLACGCQGEHLMRLFAVLLLWLIIKVDAFSQPA